MDPTEKVANECGCSLGIASHLLKQTFNDPGRAIRLFYLSLGDREVASSRPASTDSPSSPPPEMSSTRNDSASSSPSDLEPGRTAPKEQNPSVEKDQHEQQWDFTLPVVARSDHNIETFSLPEAVAMVQNGMKVNDLQQYFTRFDKADIKRRINQRVSGFSAMFYIVGSNSVEMVRLWHSFGGNVSTTAKRIPLLASAIMQSDKLPMDTTLMTATLLSLGADPTAIPSSFYSPYMQDLDDMAEMTDHAWCKGSAWKRLVETCSLSHRYYLDRAAKTGKPSVRQQQVAHRKDASPLLGITNFLIGQTSTAKALLNTLLARLVLPSSGPLVLVFAGLSGHGKTELARCLGLLLSLELLVIDCTIVQYERELFGPRPPYYEYEKGSPLNNFLAKHGGKPSIVFLDEFDKTDPAIRQALLLPFDNGEYLNRTNHQKVDTSKTIWVLATNAHDDIIKAFAAKNQGVLDGDGDLLRQLSYEVRDHFTSLYGAPVAGRVSEFIPFLPFAPGEQAVIMHQALLTLGRMIRAPVNLLEGPEERLVGNIQLRIRRDGSTCRNLAEKEYHAALGARSLKNAVEHMKGRIIAEYLKGDEEITEDAKMIELIVDVSNGEPVVSLKV